MHIRQKQNKSGSTSIVIIKKVSGKNVVVKSFGSSKDALEIQYLYQKATKELAQLCGLNPLPFEKDIELAYADSFVNCIENFMLVGPELVLGKIFDEIGFNQIQDELFRHLVITRLVYPVSKLKTTDYLFKYKGIKLSVYSIYRYLDKLHQQQLNLIKEISLRHTLSVLGGVLTIVFYDVTTLYFEAKSEDDFKRMGFSKDGKHQQPQIVLGLLVSENGYPLDYDVFEGDKYEGDTLIPIIESFVKKHQPEKLIVVADAGLMSKTNIKAIISKNYQFILGARIKNEAAAIKSQILNLKLNDAQSEEIAKDDSIRLIISYKKSRALNDKKNRKRGLEKLESKVKSGTLTKQHINNKGYNKYLKLEGQATIAIDYQKFHQDEQWDGLKGYATNTTFTKEEVVKQYHQLWTIEKTFRIAKSDLEIRPVYHQLKRRIESHICIAFAACKVYKELERQLKVKQSKLSPEKVIDILKTIYQVEFETPYSTTKYKRLVLKNEQQHTVAKIFDLFL